MGTNKRFAALVLLLCTACDNVGEGEESSRDDLTQSTGVQENSNAPSPDIVESSSDSTDDVTHADAGKIKNGLYQIKVEIPILRDTSIDAETADGLRSQMANAINSNTDWSFCVTDTQTVRGDWTELMMKIGADQRATCTKKSDTSTAATIEAEMACLEPSPKDGSLSLESSMQYRFSGDDGTIQGNMSKISIDKKDGGQATLGMAVDMQNVGNCPA